jgi:TolB-like protein
MSLFGELKRRNVFRVGVAYLVASWLIIQVSETIFPLFGFDAAARIVVVVLAIGFIPALVFAWAFELTPEGLKKEKDVDRSASITPQTGRKLDRLIMAVLALALGYFALDKFVFEPQREAAVQREKDAAVEQARQKGRAEALVESYGDRSIAVLAFDDMSPEGDQEYLSDGIAEELLNLLAKIPELRVISRASAFTFKGKDLEIPEIAERLNVSHILEGSVRKAGNRVRITAQLIEARSDTHLWSETYDRTLDDVFAIQDEIAGVVVEQLRIKLLGEVPRQRKTDPEAYALYLRARHLSRLITAEGYEQSNALYRQVLALDPDYAAAWDGLAVNYNHMSGDGLLPIDEGSRLVREAAEKALAIDPGYAKAHATLAYSAVYFDNNLPAAARHLEQALALAPGDTDILGTGAMLLFNLGRSGQSIAVDEYVTARDPVNPIRHANLSIGYFGAGRWDAAIASARTALTLSPGYGSGAQFLIGASLLFQGETQAALEAMQREPSEDDRLAGLSIAYHAMGETAASDAALAQLIDNYEKEFAYKIAAVMACRNEADRAFEWLAKAVEYRDFWLSEIVGDPLFFNLQSDPRWLPFLESIGKSPEQLAAIEFEVKLPP